LTTANQIGQVAILLNVFKTQVVPNLTEEPRIGDFIDFATTYQDRELDDDEDEYDEEGRKMKKKKKVSIPHIQRGLAKLKERYDSGLFAPVLEEMLTMPQEEIGVVSAGTVFRTDIYGILIEHWCKLFFNYLMQNTCPNCYETYTLNDLELGMLKCNSCGGHVASGICQKCGGRGWSRAEPDGKCLNCEREVIPVMSTDIVLEELQEGSSKNPTLLSEIAGIMSINRVMGGGCGIIGITQSPAVFKSGGGGQNPVYTNIGMLSFAGSISGRQDKGILREGFGIDCGTENTDEDKVQIIKYSDTRMGVKVCSITPPRSYHPMFSGFDKRRLNV
jgi:ribosomal protein L37AE/L43A